MCVKTRIIKDLTLEALKEYPTVYFPYQESDRRIREVSDQGPLVEYESGGYEVSQADLTNARLLSRKCRGYENECV